MDSEVLPSSKSLPKCCYCGCSCSLGAGSSTNWIRSVKRKYDEFEKSSRFHVPGLDYMLTAKVEIQNECNALRETVSSQQQTIQDLCAELEEERSASATAANETMSMILRLQSEKAEIQMNARQFKLFTEEKLAHDQKELAAFEDLLYKREQAIQALTLEVQAFKHRMLSYGFTEEEAEGTALSRNSSFRNVESQSDTQSYEYPPLRCKPIDMHDPSEDGDYDVIDVEKYAFCETPFSRELSSYNDGDIIGGKNVIEKVIVGYSPRNPRHSRKFSMDSPKSPFGTNRETVPELSEHPRRFSSFRKAEMISLAEDNLRRMDDGSEFGDDMSDRVYTIDAVYNGVPYNDDYVTTPKASFKHNDVEDSDIKKLYLRLQALEADRESMRQALISMSSDESQVALLKQISQHLFNEPKPVTRMPMVRRRPASGNSPLVTPFRVSKS